MVQHLITDMLPGNIHIVALKNKKWLIDVLDHEEEIKEPSEEELKDRFHILWNFFQPIIVQREKPLYLKPDEWEIRKKRFADSKA